MKVNKDKKLFIGVEIGASKHQVAIGDGDGNIYETIAGKVVLQDGADGVLAWMKEKIPLMIEKSAAYGGKVEAIGIGFGGIIESATGLSLVSVQVAGWEMFNIKEWFEKTFRLPTVVVNDTVTGGYAEYCTGSGKGSKQFFYTNIGSGIGGVFILNGEYYDGLGFGAAYFGHTYIPDWTSEVPGALCKVETMCSGFGIEKRLRRKGYVPADSAMMEMCGGKSEHITCKMLEDAGRAKDTFALMEIDRLARSYAVGLSNVITLFSPDCVSIGGGVAKMGDLLLEPVRRYVDELVFISSKGKYKIVACCHGDNAVLTGSILFAKKSLLKSGGFNG